MTAPLFQLEHLSRSFPGPSGPRAVLNDLSLDLQRRERIVLFGPSGCGKTTLLHLMAFLDLPDAGSIRYNGENSRDWTEQKRCRIRAGEIGMVFQQFHLLPFHSVLDNLRLRLRYLPGEPAAAADPEEILEEFGLQDLARQPARVLSGGEKQRLCIARAMLLPPRLLLADEPTGNLDDRNADSVKKIFQRISDGGAATVIATHDERWLDFATRILRFENGRLQEARA